MGLTSVMLQGIGILLDGLFGTGTGSTISMRVFSAHCSHENITYKSCFSTNYVFFSHFNWSCVVISERMLDFLGLLE